MRVRGPQMKSVFAILLALGFVWGCTKSGRSVPTDAQPLVGIYGNGSLEITLLKDGSYSARWVSDIGVRDIASGSWLKQDDEVHLSPVHEEPDMKGYPFSVLYVRPFKGGTALLRKEDVKYESNPLFYLHKQPKPTND